MHTQTYACTFDFAKVWSHENRLKPSFVLFCHDRAHHYGTIIETITGTIGFAVYIYPGSSMSPHILYELILGLEAYSSLCCPRHSAFFTQNLNMWFCDFEWMAITWLCHWSRKAKNVISALLICMWFFFFSLLWIQIRKMCTVLCKVTASVKERCDGDRYHQHKDGLLFNISIGIDYGASCAKLIYQLHYILNVSTLFNMRVKY